MLLVYIYFQGRFVSLIFMWYIISINNMKRMHWDKKNIFKFLNLHTYLHLEKEFKKLHLNTVPKQLLVSGNFLSSFSFINDCENDLLRKLFFTWLCNQDDNMLWDLFILCSHFFPILYSIWLNLSSFLITDIIYFTVP